MAQEIIYQTVFKIKRGYSEDWQKLNPILSAGEPGFEIDKGLLKVGNGVTKWNDLPDVAGAYALSPDKKSLILNNYGELSVYGFEDAEINTLPIKDENGKIKWISASDPRFQATSERAGIVKLYSNVGQNTDGTMTQKGITDSLDEKIEMEVDTSGERLILGSNL